MKSSIYLSLLALLILSVLAAGCGAGATVEPTPWPATATPLPDLPKVTSLQADRADVPRYERVEITVEIEAKYSNPYDAREVALDAVFTAPDGNSMKVPGFWNGEGAWLIRFTPSQEGEWKYQVTVTDRRGMSLPMDGTLNVTSSDLHGWLQTGSMVDPAYSSRYLAFHDGTPFYGIGHCEALNIMDVGFSIDNGVWVFDDMKAAGENYVVWWPLYSSSPITSAYDDYSVPNMKVIDTIIKDAEKENIFLVFTIWDHPQLRTKGHAWGAGNWDNNNGFRNLGDIDSFFTSDEAWAWQENFYRYIIARWGYSNAIASWQLVSEINGTNAYEQTDGWHEKVNSYFVENDPYRHPTTASKSGDVAWVEGYRVTDMPQVHVYEFEEDAVKAAEIIAYWTSQMWQAEAKPNWIGEYGMPGNTYYPELSHNAIWAALASGAAMTPAEWNSGGSWMTMTPEMYADQARLAQFIADMPLVKLKPEALEISSSDPQVRAWGIAGANGGLFWAQDFALEGKTMEEVRADETVRTGVELSITGLAGGSYTVLPYDTWQGVFLDGFDVRCDADRVCVVALPKFNADMAFKILKK